MDCMKNIFTYIEINRDEEFFEPEPASEPTTHAPGSEGKIEVMRRRLLRGEHLHHPEDEKVLATHEVSEAARFFVMSQMPIRYNLKKPARKAKGKVN